MKSESKNRPLLISIICSIFLAIGTAAIAATGEISANITSFDVMTNIYIDGELVSSSHIITNTNKNATITMSDDSGMNNIQINLIAKDAITPEINNAIELSYDIKIQKKGEIIKTKPLIVVHPNQEATINMSNSDGHTLDMNVIAVRKKV